MHSITLALPTVDCIFKGLFSEVIDLLADLICSFEDWPVGHIKKLTYANTEYAKKRKDGKSCRMDLVADLQTGERVIIEVQSGQQIYYRKKALYYAALAYTGPLDKNANYSTLKKVISIHILNFNKSRGILHPKCVTFGWR